MTLNKSLFTLISAYTGYLADNFVDDLALATNSHLSRKPHCEASHDSPCHEAEAQQDSSDTQPSSDDLRKHSLTSINAPTPPELSRSPDVVESALPSDVFEGLPVLNDRLKILNIFGTGGYSAVHLGELKSGDETLRVAVKLFFVDFDDEAELAHTSRRIAREIKLISEISHPNLVEFFGICTDASDLGVSEETPALVTELCEGRTIEKYLRKHPHTLRLPLMLDAAIGLEYLHSNDVIHGDLKPDNILISCQGSKIKAVIGDFGRSRVCNRRGFTTKLATTIMYAAPELVVDAEDLGDNSDASTKKPVEVTKASDIYSFGLTLLTVVSGNPPFYDHQNGAKILMKLAIHKQRPSRSHHECSEMNDDLWRLMEECWQAEPGARSEMKGVANRLRGIVRGDN